MRANVLLVNKRTRLSAIGVVVIGLERVTLEDLLVAVGPFFLKTESVNKRQ